VVQIIDATGSAWHEALPFFQLRNGFLLPSQPEQIQTRECPLLARSGHALLHRTCPLSGVKQTRPYAEIRFCGRYWG
jgi:hypothetical protein